MPSQVPRAHSLADTSAPQALTGRQIRPSELPTKPACKWPNSGPLTLMKVRITAWFCAAKGRQKRQSMSLLKAKRDLHLRAAQLEHIGFND